jgi:hypothetical protein
MLFMASNNGVEFGMAEAGEIRGLTIKNPPIEGMDSLWYYNSIKLLYVHLSNRPSFQKVSDSVPAHRKFVGVP